MKYKKRQGVLSERTTNSPTSFEHGTPDIVVTSALRADFASQRRHYNAHGSFSTTRFFKTFH